jgi:hypothetical protein
MGVRLMVEVLDRCPADASLAERLLLVALAEKASDETRRVIWSRGESPREVLRRRLGVSDSGLTKAFARLAHRGLDPRVAITKDKRGRPVYAYEGTAVEYVIPALSACPTGEALVDNSPESLPDGATTQGAEGGRPGTLNVTTGEALEPESLPDGAGHIPPSLNSPSIDARERNELLPTPTEHRVAVLELLGRHGTALAEEDAVDCVAWVAKVITPTNLAGYLSRFSAEDIRTRASQHRDETAPVQDSRKCPHGTINGQQILGRGTNASRRCDRCEQSRPAEFEAIAPPTSRVEQHLALARQLAAEERAS